MIRSHFDIPTITMSEKPPNNKAATPRSFSGIECKRCGGEYHEIHMTAGYCVDCIEIVRQEQRERPRNHSHRAGRG